MNSTIEMHVNDSNITVEYNVIRCKKCILSSNYPNIHFNKDGICNYCSSEQGKAPNEEIKREALSQVFQLISQSKSKIYDCLVLFSGGKDSSYSLFVIKNILKLNPLALTIDNGFVSNAVFPNMKKILGALDIDHILFKPSSGFMSALYRTSIQHEEEDVSRIMYATSSCGSCISMVLAIGAQECKNRNIPVMMGGWSPGQLTEMPFLPGSFIEKICSQHFKGLEIKRPDLEEKIKKYYSISSEFPGLYNPLYGIEYNENEIIKTLNSLGWVKPPDTDSCSSNCRLNGYLIIDHIKKYGFHPYEYELAFHVRNGMAEREEVLEKIANIAVNQRIIELVHLELGLDTLKMVN